MRLIENKCELDDVSIVILGSFNPAIFHPLWFRDQNLLRSEEAENARVEIIHHEATIFRTDWLTLQVVGEKFLANSSDASMYVGLRDLVIGTFKLLEHTPVTAMGLNSQAHFSVESLEEWHEIGHTLAPKAVWAGVLEEPGMRSMVVQGTREDVTADKVNVKVEPSIKVQPGVYVDVNLHYDLQPDPDQRVTAGSSGMLQRIEADWAAFMEYRTAAPQRLIRNVSLGGQA